MVEPTHLKNMIVKLGRSFPPKKYFWQKKPVLKVTGETKNPIPIPHHPPLDPHHPRCGICLEKVGPKVGVDLSCWGFGRAFFFRKIFRSCLASKERDFFLSCVDVSVFLFGGKVYIREIYIYIYITYTCTYFLVILSFWFCLMFILPLACVVSVWCSSYHLQDIGYVSPISMQYLRFLLGWWLKTR